MGGKPKKRCSKPTDWVEFLRQRAMELELTVEITRRLRKAAELTGIQQKHGSKCFTCGWSIQADSRWSEIGAIWRKLKTPKEIATSLSPSEIELQLSEWEHEAQEWATPIWEAMADMIRLRGERYELLLMHKQFPDFPRTEIWRMLADAKAMPNQTVSSQTGKVRMKVSFGYADSPARPIADVDLEELAEIAKDPRHLRRLLDNPPAKSRGGVREIAPALLNLD